MRAVFMGTPAFAVPTLRCLTEDKDTEVVGVVTQPDRRAGRGKKIRFSPVKELAVSCGIPVIQPEKLREEENVQTLRDWNPDVIVVAAYGQILSEEILRIPPMGCINVHASLLPKYRGASPVQQCIIDGCRTTGVTTMYMDRGLDTGDILLQKEIPIDDTDDGESLEEKLAIAGGPLLIETLKGLADGSITPVKQDESESSYVHMYKKSYGLIDWNSSADSIEHKVRGMIPWPGAFTFLKGKTLKIWKSALADTEETGLASGSGYEPGTISYVDKKHMLVQTGEGLLSLKEVQLEGKKRMPLEDFLRGCRLSAGDRLDDDRSAS